MLRIITIFCACCLITGCYEPFVVSSLIQDKIRDEKLEELNNKCYSKENYELYVLIKRQRIPIDYKINFAKVDEYRSNGYFVNGRGKVTDLNSKYIYIDAGNGNTVIDLIGTRKDDIGCFRQFRGKITGGGKGSININ